MRRVQIAVFVVILAFVFVSCTTPTATMRVLRPAVLEVAGVKTVRIDFLEQGGSHGAEAAPHVARALAAQLTAGGKYRIIGGGATERPDAVILGKVWCAVSNRTGEEKAVKSERKTDGNVIFPKVLEQSDFIAIKQYSMSVSLIKVELTMVRYTVSSAQAETVASRTSTRSTCIKIGGVTNAPYRADFDFSNPRFSESAFRNIAEAVVSGFVALVSPHYEEVRAGIAPGSEDAERLLRRGRLAEAREVLERRLNSVEGIARAPILYNIGLAWEAEGTLDAILLAEKYYEQAFRVDDANRLYAEGLGRIEKLKREFAILAERAHKG